MLKLENLTVSTNNKKLLDSLTLTVKDGEIHLVMGPNGAGKSSLANAIMGHPNFKTKGSIVVNGKDVSKLSPDKRAAKGLFLAFQHPEEIEGVKVGNFVRKAKATNSGEKQDMDKMMETQEKLEKSLVDLGLRKEFSQRELNIGFSGGEKKRLEMTQMISLEPNVIILDEIDSGLDVDGVKLVADAIKKMQDGKRSFLIITHYPRILKYLKPNFVHIMVNGKLVDTGDAKLAEEIEKNGYEKYGRGAK